MDRCRRHGKALSDWDSGPTQRLLEATARKLCRDFRDLERPFLNDSPDNKESGSREKEWDEYTHGGFENDYRRMTFYHRFTWLRCKDNFENLSRQLERLQIRRIERELTDALGEIKQLKTELEEVNVIGPGGGTGVAVAGGGRGPARSRSRRRSFARDGSSDDPVFSDEEDRRERVRARRASRRRH